MTMSQRNGMTGVAVLLLGWAPGAIWANPMLINQTFNGTSATNWGWESQVDTGSRLSGTDQMIYTYPGTAGNVAGYVSSSITDAATVFPTGMGTLTVKFQVDLSNFPTFAGQYSGPELYEIAAPGNNSWFTGGTGMISTVGFTGFNADGMYRFFSASGAFYGYDPGQMSTAYNLGTSPSFPLIYDITSTVDISHPAQWVVTTDVSINGPIDNVGTIGTITIPTSTYSPPDGWGFTGWLATSAYHVGNGDGTWSGTIPAGNAYTFNSFSTEVVPEPGTLALVALGSLVMLRQGKIKPTMK